MIDYGPVIQRFGHLDGAELLAAMVREVFPRRLAVVSSFGAESAVLLHMLAGIDRSVPVIFLDTAKLFEETLAYRDRLVADLRLADVRSITPASEALTRHDPNGDLNAFDPDRCCRIRKVEPLQRALDGFQAWVTGRKRFHGGERSNLPVLEPVEWRLKINPLARWSRDDIASYLDSNGLARHPLEAHGYQSIGCRPCTSPAGAGGVRDGRWAGLSKTECGIHWAHNGRPVRTAQNCRG